MSPAIEEKLDKVENKAGKDEDGLVIYKTISLVNILSLNV